MKDDAIASDIKKRVTNFLSEYREEKPKILKEEEIPIAKETSNTNKTSYSQSSILCEHIRLGRFAIYIIGNNDFVKKMKKIVGHRKIRVATSLFPVEKNLIITYTTIIPIKKRDSLQDSKNEFHHADVTRLYEDEAKNIAKIHTIPAKKNDILIRFHGDLTDCSLQEITTITSHELWHPISFFVYSSVELMINRQNKQADREIQEVHAKVKATRFQDSVLIESYNRLLLTIRFLKNMMQ